MGGTGSQQDKPQAPGLEGFTAGLGETLARHSAALAPPEKEDVVNVALMGTSGTGKSLFLNTMRSVKPGEENSAPVGVSDTTTKEPAWYEFPGTSALRLWDTECACEGPPVDTYVSAFDLDVLVVVTSGRFMETENAILEEVKDRDLPWFFVRTKLDLDIANNIRDNGFSPEKTEESIREDLRRKGVEDAYLIDARSAGEHDFPRLIADLDAKIAGIIASRAGSNTVQTASTTTAAAAPTDVNGGGSAAFNKPCVFLDFFQDGTDELEYDIDKDVTGSTFLYAFSTT